MHFNCRRYRNEVSEQLIGRHLHDARQAVNRLGRIISGDRESIRRVMNSSRRAPASFSPSGLFQIKEGMP